MVNKTKSTQQVARSKPQTKHNNEKVEVEDVTSKENDSVVNYLEPEGKADQEIADLRANNSKVDAKIAQQEDAMEIDKDEDVGKDVFGGAGMNSPDAEEGALERAVNRGSARVDKQEEKMEVDEDEDIYSGAEMNLLDTEEEAQEREANLEQDEE